jgi:hypothetical protein
MQGKQYYYRPSRGDKKCIQIFDEETSHKATTSEIERLLRRDGTDIERGSGRYMKMVRVI